MKFKVGDVVRVVEPFNTMERVRDFTGVIVKVHNEIYPYDVDIDLPDGTKETSGFAEEELEIAKSYIINTILNEI